MTRTLAALTLVAALACTRTPRAGKEARTGDAGAAPADATGRPPAPALGPDPYPTHLVVHAHARGQARARYLPIRLTERWPAAGRAEPETPFELEVAAGSGDRVDLAAFSSPALVAVTPAGLVARDIGTGADRTIPLAERITAIAVRGPMVYLAAGKRIGYLDLAAAAPAFQLIYEHRGEPVKPYDLISRDRDLLVVVDDRMLPFFAESLTLDGAGRPVHRASFDLPSMVNGHYDAAHLARGADGNGLLYLVSGYVQHGNSGQELTAERWADGQPAGSHPHGYSERDTDPGYTGWRATGLVSTRDGRAALVLAAGDRGLTWLPGDLASPPAAAAAEPCLDVVTFGDVVFALFGAGDAATLRAFRWDGQKLVAEGTAAALPGPYAWFVR
jgi:hypothetical protein